jgi:uncharacterized protein YvpB
MVFAGRGGSGSSPAPATSGPTVLRLVSDGRAVAQRQIDRLRSPGDVRHWVSGVTTDAVEHRGPAEITVHTSRAALADRIRHAVATDRGRVTVPKRPIAARIQLPVVPQALHNDCEATALSMLLRDRGVHVDQLTLQAQVAKNGPLTPRPPSSGAGQEVWGDPSRGFVGSADGEGYGVYQGPIAALARHHGIRLRDLTGSRPQAVYRELLAGHPVMAWVALSAGPYETWRTPSGRIVHANFGEHAVVLTGISGDSLTVNDPLSGQRLTWTRSQFEGMWAGLGRRALAA